jgi:hypothetical protein
VIRGLLAGAAAGAAGTTALNAATYADMVLRGRAVSSTPERTVEAIARLAGITIPGAGAVRESRVSALGALAGLATGVGVGAALGAARELGWRPGAVTGGLLTSAVVLAAANGPMIALGITDPRTWSVADWMADIVPHAAYGLVTHATINYVSTSPSEF